MQKNGYVFLGMSCARPQSISAERAHGALIVDIDPASSAARAGVQAGDVILEINHQTVSGAKHAWQLGRRLKQERVLFHVWKQGNSRFVIMYEVEEINTCNESPYAKELLCYSRHHLGCEP